MPESPAPIEVAGPYREDRAIVDAVLGQVGLMREVMQFETEIPHTFERSAQIMGLEAAYKRLGEDIGVDLASRFPESDRYHFFATRADLHAALRQMGEQFVDNVDGRTNMQGMFMLDQGNDLEDMCLAAHETVHFLTQRKAVVRNADTEGGLRLDFSRNGYRTHKALAAAEEMFTDLTYLHLREGGYWAGQRLLPQNPAQIRYYSSLDIIGDQLIQKTAEVNGLEPLEVLQTIERDRFLGESKGLRLLMGSIEDPKAKRQFAQALHYGRTTEESAVFAEELGLPKAAELIRDQSTVRVLDWLHATDRLQETS